MTKPKSKPTSRQVKAADIEAVIDPGIVGLRGDVEWPAVIYLDARTLEAARRRQEEARRRRKPKVKALKP
jgi:hypothetical protein